MSEPHSLNFSDKLAVVALIATIALQAIPLNAPVRSTFLLGALCAAVYLCWHASWQSWKKWITAGLLVLAYLVVVWALFAQDGWRLWPRQQPSDAQTEAIINQAVAAMSRGASEDERRNGIQSLGEAMKRDDETFFRISRLFMWRLRGMIPRMSTQDDAGSRPEVNTIMTVWGENNEAQKHPNNKQIDLSQLNFRGLYLKDANFDGFNFVGSDFTGAHFENVSFKDSNFDYAIFTGASLSGCMTNQKTIGFNEALQNAGVTCKESPQGRVWLYSLLSLLLCVLIVGAIYYKKYRRHSEVSEVSKVEPSIQEVIEIDRLLHVKIAEVKAEWKRLNKSQKQLLRRIYVMGQVSWDQIDEEYKSKLLPTSTDRSLGLDYLLERSTLLEGSPDSTSLWQLKYGENPILHVYPTWKIRPDLRVAVGEIIGGESDVSSKQKAKST